MAAPTGRETEVLEPVGRGLTDAEAADRLFISEATARTHLDRAMSGLGPGRPGPGGGAGVRAGAGDAGRVGRVTDGRRTGCVRAVTG
ncbi:helix-turn-helix transcriptional regulator [Streptomyces pharetrae]|uniref:helix-turn-helix transcriptional regulator n=1 Tax=Streptomyces pharetrae TaxID=291370 RepID=UPI003361AC60